ncbi:MAG TPA: hypothetical protein VI479_09675, partial [Blastocatellia bacterium]
VDSLRGFALFGVFWANLLIFSSIDYLTEEQRASLFLGRLEVFGYCFERFLIEKSSWDSSRFFSASALD